MKILVIGNGFLGKPLAKYLNADVWTKRLNKITAEDLEPYGVIINTAAKTSIDWCEENRLEAFQTNMLDAGELAILTRYLNKKLVFFSSGCIFKSIDHKDVKYEDSKPNPQCIYTYTKLMAEDMIKVIDPNALIIRPRLLISEKSSPRNTIDKLLSYKYIINTQESATILEDLIPKVKELIDQGVTGPVNVFNEGTISPSEIANAFGHMHQIITKSDLDELTKDRATRVSTVLGTNKTTPMPNIHTRIQQIANNWK